MSIREAASFCRRFGVGYRSGVNLLRLLDSEARFGTARHREVFGRVRDSAADGGTLHEAMKRDEDYFPALIVAMTQAGEVTGSLDRTMLSLADYYDERVRLFREFLSRITFPAIQLVAVVNILALIIYIMGMNLTGNNEPMMDMLGFGLRGGSGVLIWYCMVAFGVACLVAMVYAFKANVGGVHNIIPLLYRVPVAGAALQTITIARFCWTLALSLEAGVDPIRSIKMGLNATGSEYYRLGADDAERAIRNGGTMSDALSATGLFPQSFIIEIETAELSGTDAEAMHHLAAQYDERAAAATKALAGIASMVVRIGAFLLILMVVIRMLMNVVGAYGQALHDAQHI